MLLSATRAGTERGLIGVDHGGDRACPRRGPGKPAAGTALPQLSEQGTGELCGYDVQVSSRCVKSGPMRGLLMRAGFVSLCAKVTVIAACGFPRPADIGDDAAGPMLDGGLPPTPSLELLAGSIGGAGNGDGTGATARFNLPSGVAVDRVGNVYVADQNNHTIRKITAAGVVTTLAGSAGVAGYANGTGASARFIFPFPFRSGVAVDRVGNIYVADTGNDTIRRVTADGIVSTLAGIVGNEGHADGTAAEATFAMPLGVAVDSAGSVYVADRNNATIRKITAAGVVGTLAGTAGNFGHADGSGAAASFGLPSGVAVDGVGNVYVADQNNQTIRKVTAAGVVTTFAGTTGVVGSLDGTGANARFNSPADVAVDSAGNIYVADQGNETIRKITIDGTVTTLAGIAGISGSADGTGAAARFGAPVGVAVDSAGNIYVADQLGHTIRKVTAVGAVTTLAGAAYAPGTQDGTGAAASFSFPAGVAGDNAGNVYVAEEFGTIRKISGDGVVTTLAGTPGAGSSDGTGGAAHFNDPTGVAVDGAGNVAVADKGNCTIRKITAAGVVTTLAGTVGAVGHADGPAAIASFALPTGVTVDSLGNVFVADQSNSTIRKVTPDGVVTTLAGSAGNVGHADGTGIAASFNRPFGLTLDSVGNMYVADTGNSTIRKITAAGVVTTLAGTAGSIGHADGTGVGASFNGPTAVAVDSAGDVFVADQANSTIRKITAAGTTTTVAGTPGVTGIVLGAIPRLVAPTGLAIVGDSIIITDQTAILLLRHVVQ